MPHLGDEDVSLLPHVTTVKQKDSHGDRTVGDAALIESSTYGVVKSHVMIIKLYQTKLAMLPILLV